MGTFVEVDEDTQRKLALNAFMENSAVFKKQLYDYVAYAAEQVNTSLTNGAIDQKDLSKLNYNLGRKQGLEMALNIFDMFKEELEETSSARRKIAK